ncbi:hypothetical protein EMIT0P201_30095 [Pseudomonas chlororaphis]
MECVCVSFIMVSHLDLKEFSHPVTNFAEASKMLSE